VAAMTIEALASVAGSFCSSFLQTGDRAESTRKDSHWPIAAQGSFQWENEPGPNQVSPLGRETRPILVSLVGQRHQSDSWSVQWDKVPRPNQVSPVGKGTTGKPGQSSVKRNQEKPSHQLGKGTRAILVSLVGKGTRENQVSSVGKRQPRSVQWEKEPGQTRSLLCENESGQCRSLPWDEEPGPNQVTPVQKWIRGKQGQPVGKGTREKLGQSSVTRSQAETRSVQWEEERRPNQGVQWENEPRLNYVSAVWKGTRWKPGQDSGKRNQGQTWSTYQTLFPLLFLFEEEALWDFHSFWVVVRPPTIILLWGPNKDLQTWLWENEGS
jgi:hypothetical protein